MCGIAGYFGTGELPPERLTDTLGLMQRRGPDHQAWQTWRNLAGRNMYLLHSRLSIIDLDERANQPMRFASKNLVFNGELYNYLELKNELQATGAHFQTTSDTEVLLQAIQTFNWAVLERCEGMWAFALYDEADGSLTLCRDRFGEKPLYFFEDDTGFYFASEVKFIFALLGRRLPVNYDHLCRYLVNGYKALYKQDQMFFVGLRELPPAATLTLDASGGRTQELYWQPECRPQPSMTYAAAVAGARQRLLRSMELRLRADVPLAFCMSGGIDSNSLISIAKNVFGYDVHGFTIINTDERYEEQDLINYAVRELGIRHTPIPLETKDFLPRLRTLIKYHDAPVYTITYFAHWLLMESIAQHGYRISVSGTAADELFTGYFDHHLFYLTEVQDQRDVFQPSLASWQKHIQPLVRNPFLTDPQNFLHHPGMRDHIYFDADGFRQYLRRDWREPFAEETFTDHVLRNRMLNEMFHEVIPVILHEDDLNAMYFSIENRSPFLDRSLFDFCFQIPTPHLIRQGYAKAVLRDAMLGIVPEKILTNHRKVGFNAPIFSFLDTQDPEVRNYLLDDSPVFELINKDMIAALINQDFVPNSQSKFIFYFLCSKMFVEEFAA